MRVAHWLPLLLTIGCQPVREDRAIKDVGIGLKNLRRRAPFWLAT